MRHRLAIAVHATLALLALCGPARALRGQRPVTVGIIGGVSLPQGDFGDGVDAGWHAVGTLALGSLMQPFGLRLDGAYNRFGGAAGGGALTATTGTLDVTYRLPTVRSPLSPYVIGGAGAYHLACSGGAACDATTRFGWNAGLGVRFAGLMLHGLVEARYHHVALPGGDVSYFPLSVGLTF